MPFLARTLLFSVCFHEVIQFENIQANPKIESLLHTLQHSLRHSPQPLSPPPLLYKHQQQGGGASAYKDVTVNTCRYPANSTSTTTSGIHMTTTSLSAKSVGDTVFTPSLQSTTPLHKLLLSIMRDHPLPPDAAMATGHERQGGGGGGDGKGGGMGVMERVYMRLLEKEDEEHAHMLERWVCGSCLCIGECIASLSLSLFEVFMMCVSMAVGTKLWV